MSAASDTVRSWKGRNGAWFPGTQVRHEGHIEAGGVGKNVAFVMASDYDIKDRIDAAYRTKYRRHGGQYVEPMVAAPARAATIKLVPRSTTPSLNRPTRAKIHGPGDVNPDWYHCFRRAPG